MGYTWGVCLLVSAVGAGGGCARRDKDAELRDTLRRVAAAVPQGDADRRPAGVRLDLARAMEEQRARAATRPTTGPAARWRWMTARASFLPGDGEAVDSLADDERFAATGKTFRLVCVADRSTVVCLPTGERLTVDD